jgi:threonine synthase
VTRPLHGDAARPHPDDPARGQDVGGGIALHEHQVRPEAGTDVAAVRQTEGASGADVAAAVRLLAERAHVVAEGAGAAPVAAALSGRAGPGKVVCVVSGGNIDGAVLARILAGETP